jgi:hypothetical protein
MTAPPDHSVYRSILPPTAALHSFRIADKRRFRFATAGGYRSDFSRNLAATLASDLSSPANGRHLNHVLWFKLGYPLSTNHRNSRRPAAILDVFPLYFLPDFTEHPKPRPKRRKSVVHLPSPPPPSSPPPSLDDESGDVSFWHDFVGGGVAGTASVIVGHVSQILSDS